MSRHTWILAVFVFLLVIGTGNRFVQAQQEFSELSLEEYEKQLNAILKTRLPEEKKFVSLVIEEVRKGRISRKLVDTSFKWVRNRRPGTRYPFVYFERVLRLQAKRLNKKIPPFDYSIYSDSTRRSNRLR